jgi:nucleoside-diphosphate-sugar epimerase
VTHPRQAFVDTNITGTLNLLEEVALAGAVFVFTSTTSTFGAALTPPPGAPAAWITEAVAPVPKNIYGVTKIAAEDLCELVHRMVGLPCMILRVSRFFPEEDDSAETRIAYSADNAKANEYLYRRVDLEDVVSAHLCALDRARTLGFGRYIISATTPFEQADLSALRADAPAVVRRHYPELDGVYARLGWRMFPEIERVYVNRAAREELGWRAGRNSRRCSRTAAGRPSRRARRSPSRPCRSRPASRRRRIPGPDLEATAPRGVAAARRGPGALRRG